MTKNFEAGEIILIDKPAGWTSFDVVKKIRSALQRHSSGPDGSAGSARLGRLKVGHAGTLDPLATGLLLLCTGTATKKISDLQLMEKEYTGTFFIGSETDSYDLETPTAREFATDHITESMIHQKAREFTGTVMQVPPVHSAVMSDGRRAYEKARKGQPVSLKARPVSIHEFEIVHAALPLVEFRVVCSKGTYIRSLAYDFGKALAAGAYLNTLRRTRIGSFSVSDALSPEKYIVELNRETGIS